MSDRPRLAIRVLINDESELRCGWRLLIFFVAFYFFSAMLAALVSALGTVVPALARLTAGVTNNTSAGQRLAGYFLNTIILLVAVLAASLLCARLLERRSLASVGYKLHRGWWRDFALGLALGAVTLAISVGIMSAAGAARFTVQISDAAGLSSNFAALFVFFLLAAAFEELLIRGFAFQALAHNAGPAAAIAITSIAFGLIHLNNPSATVLSTINTILAGVWLGVAYWKTRSLWLATALHMSWNFAMAFIFGLPVSGLNELLGLAWLSGEPGSPVWLSGGNYGPEGGGAATAALILSTTLIWKSRLFAPSSDMLGALTHGPRNKALQSERVP